MTSSLFASWNSRSSLPGLAAEPLPSPSDAARRAAPGARLPRPESKLASRLDALPTDPKPVTAGVQPAQASKLQDRRARRQPNRVLWRVVADPESRREAFASPLRCRLSGTLA